MSFTGLIYGNTLREVSVMRQAFSMLENCLHSFLRADIFLDSLMDRFLSMYGCFFPVAWSRSSYYYVNPKNCIVSHGGRHIILILVITFLSLTVLYVCLLCLCIVVSLAVFWVLISQHFILVFF